MLMRFLVDNRVVVYFDLATALVEDLVEVSAASAIDITSFIVKVQWCMSMGIWYTTGFALSRK